MDLEILGELFQDYGGPGGVPVAVGTDIISYPFDFLPAHEGVEKRVLFAVTPGFRNLFSRF